MRILELEIHEIRGIRDLTIRPDEANIVIWGPNGAGKSAVVDAIDFLLTGSMSRLRGRGTGGISLSEHGPHVDSDLDAAYVRAVVSLPTVQEPVELSRRIAAPSQIECEEAVRPRVEEMLNLARRGQHVLTRREILRFITAEAGTRAQEIQALLNLTPIENVRRALVTVRNDFRELMETARSSHASTLAWDPAVADLPYSVVINRMSPSSWLRGHGSTVQSTAHYLVYLESIGVPVINGSQAYAFEISKARQLRLLNELGITHPKARVINRPTEAVGAAEGLTYPVIVKPNVGGSGAGIVSFESPESLGAAAKAGELEFGPDDTALVQEHLTAEDDAIVRIEFLDGEFLYAIRLRLTPGTFNLCPADYCGILGAADTNDEYAPIEAFKPSPEIIKDAKRLLDATGADLGGVEYLIDAASGEASFYDINALSNFVADAQTIIGFDPFIDLVDFIADRIGYD